MSDEEVLYHSDAENITVTNARLIYGDEVIPIGNIKVAACRRSVSIFNDHPIATLLGWKKWRMWVRLRGGDEALDEASRTFSEPVAKQIVEAVNKAIARWEIENDPRKGLNLPRR